MSYFLGSGNLFLPGLKQIFPLYNSIRTELLPQALKEIPEVLKKLGFISKMRGICLLLFFFFSVVFTRSGKVLVVSQ